MLKPESRIINSLGLNQTNNHYTLEIQKSTFDYLQVIINNEHQEVKYNKIKERLIYEYALILHLIMCRLNDNTGFGRVGVYEFGLITTKYKELLDNLKKYNVITKVANYSTELKVANGWTVNSRTDDPFHYSIEKRFIDPILFRKQERLDNNCLKFNYPENVKLSTAVFNASAKSVIEDVMETNTINKNGDTNASDIFTKKIIEDVNTGKWNMIKKHSASTRLYSTFTNMPKLLRKFLVADNKPLIEVDIKASHPTLLPAALLNVIIPKIQKFIEDRPGALNMTDTKIKAAVDSILRFKDEMLCHDDFYSVLAKGINAKSREDVKIPFLIYINADFIKTKDCIHQKDKNIVKDIKIFMELNYPEMCDVIELARNLNRKPSTVKNFSISHALMKIESNLILGTASDFRKAFPQEAIITVHDSLLVKEEYVEWITNKLKEKCVAKNDTSKKNTFFANIFVSSNLKEIKSIYKAYKEIKKASDEAIISDDERILKIQKFKNILQKQKLQLPFMFEDFVEWMPNFKNVIGEEKFKNKSLDSVTLPLRVSSIY